MTNIDNLIEQLRENKRVICTKLIPFKEYGEFFVRWEGNFIDEATGSPMKLIIPKLSMNILKLDTGNSFLNPVALATLKADVIQENKQDILFIIKVDKEE